MDHAAVIGKCHHCGGKPNDLPTARQDATVDGSKTASVPDAVPRISLRKQVTSVKIALHQTNRWR